MSGDPGRIIPYRRGVSGDYILTDLKPVWLNVGEISLWISPNSDGSGLTVKAYRLGHEAEPELSMLEAEL